MSAVPAVAVYATRYAVGRLTGAGDDVCSFIFANLDEIRRDAGCTQAIIRALGDTEDWGPARERWRQVYDQLLAPRDGAA